MRILEIGPSYAPLAPRAEGWNVCVVDHATREELIEKYSDPALQVGVDRIEDVDVVWHGGPLTKAIGPERHGFDVCLVSHVLEHTPDFVGFLGGVMQSLAPSGWLSLAFPDMRYCFDLLRTPTRLGEVVAAYVGQPSFHSLATLVDQQIYTVRKGERTSWHESHQGDLRFTGSVRGIASLIYSQDDPSEYVDAHVWRFTPASFELIILELSALGLLDIHVASIHDTVGCEFFVELRPGAQLPESAEEIDAARLALLERSVREVAAVWATVGA
jgi:hypothetical protein